jgi:predicted nucleic acid-binding protein
LPAYFFDSSALAKLYHPEAGTAVVEEMVNGAGHVTRISRLTMIELSSVFAIKVRTGFIDRGDAEFLLRQLREDAISERFEVFAFGETEYSDAESLIERYAFELRLRSLDALQLAVARSLRRQSMIDYFVASDRVLCEVARLESFAVVDPERP